MSERAELKEGLLNHSQRDSSFFEEYNSRSTIQRYIGPMAEGSIRGSIFTFLSVGLGTGILSFPGLMAKNGFITAILIILIGAFSAKWSMDLIITGVRRSHVTTFQDLALVGGGEKTKKLLEISIVVFVIGGCISY